MTKSGRFLLHAFLASGAALLLRLIQVFFNVFLSGHIGADGLGRFSLILSVYGFLVTLAVSGFRLAVTRVISEEREVGNEAAAAASFRTALVFAALSGTFAAVLLFLSAGPAAVFLLRDASGASALRLLSAALPALSLTSVCGGALTAIRRSWADAFAGVCGQVFRVGVTVFLLFRGGFSSPALVLSFGTVLSEYVTLFCCLPFLPRRWLCRPRVSAGDSASGRAEKNRVSQNLLRIVLPIGVTSCVRSALLGLEHLLIPVGLSRSGLDGAASLALYGTVHAVVLPLILFPSAYLSAVAWLVIPEIAALRAGQFQKRIVFHAHRLLRGTLFSAFLVSACLICWSAELGTLLSDVPETGHCIRVLAALVPVMYLDTMVDALLKGLDAQLASMRYNLIDTSLSVLLALFLLPRYGLSGYFLLLYSSELLNFSLSFSKLLSLTGLHPRLWDWMIFPLGVSVGAAVLSVLTARLFEAAGLVFRFGWVSLFFHVLLSGCYAAVLIFCFSGGKTGVFCLHRKQDEKT